MAWAGSGRPGPGVGLRPDQVLAAGIYRHAGVRRLPRCLPGTHRRLGRWGLVLRPRRAEPVREREGLLDAGVHRVLGVRVGEQPQLVRDGVGAARDRHDPPPGRETRPPYFSRTSPGSCDPQAADGARRPPEGRRTPHEPAAGRPATLPPPQARPPAPPPPPATPRTPRVLAGGPLPSAPGRRAPPPR